MAHAKQRSNMCKSTKKMLSMDSESLGIGWSSMQITMPTCFPTSPTAGSIAAQCGDASLVCVQLQGHSNSLRAAVLVSHRGAFRSKVDEWVCVHDPAIVSQHILPSWRLNLLPADVIPSAHNAKVPAGDRGYRTGGTGQGAGGASNELEKVILGMLNTFPLQDPGGNEACSKPHMQGWSRVTNQCLNKQGPPLSQVPGPD